jgi:hypothetical protein
MWEADLTVVVSKKKNNFVPQLGDAHDHVLSYKQNLHALNSKKKYFCGHKMCSLHASFHVATQIDNVEDFAFFVHHLKVSLRSRDSDLIELFLRSAAMTTL